METAEYASIPASVRLQLEDVCRRRLPYETCGVMFGRTSGAETRIDGFAVVRNAAQEPTRAFAFDPEDWIRTRYEAQKNQRNIVGFFHSHPDGSALPSGKDGEGRPPAGTYWIVGMKESGCDIRVYSGGADTGWKELSLRDQ